MTARQPSRGSGPGPFDAEIRYDVRIPTEDPEGTLSADLYLPRSDIPAAALISAYPYRKDLPTGSSSLAPTFEWLASHGYACVLIDLRGTGASDGIQRPVCDAGEGDDLIATIEWTAAQPWCTGKVGMWGQSYGGVTTLRAASRKPEALKAIIPMVCPIDPERDGMFPAGARSDMLQRVWWAGGLLATQILPPLEAHSTAEGHRRWQTRLNLSEPYLVDLAHHPAGDPSWRDRAIDLASISIPAFCVGGWRDLYAESTVRMFAELSGPKKLLMGPWGHSMPEDSPDGPIAFLPMALRWWDHWLRGIDTGIMDEPAVTVFIEGEGGGWWSLPSGMPAGTRTYATGSDLTLTEPSSKQPTEPAHSGPPVIGVVEADPTIGMLGGPLGLAGHPVGHSMNPREEAACLAAQTPPLTEPLDLCGPARVTVSASVQERPHPERLVARLAEVTPQGASRYVTGGVLMPIRSEDDYTIALNPIAWHVTAGSSLRLLLSDGDFPRLTPLAFPEPIQVSRVELSLSTLDDATQRDIDITLIPEPNAGALAPGAEGLQGMFVVNRDLVNDEIEILVGPNLDWTPTPHGHLLRMHGEVRAKVRRDAPDAAETCGIHTLQARMSTGEEVQAVSDVRVTQWSVWAHAKVTIDNRTVYTRTWDIPLDPGSGGQP